MGSEHSPLQNATATTGRGSHMEAQPKGESLASNAKQARKALAPFFIATAAAALPARLLPA
jgi:hypothetical protein